MPFIRKTDAALSAMTTEALISYCQVVEGLFAAIRSRHQRRRVRGPCPQEWRDCSDEISAVQHLVVFRSMVDAHVDAMLPETEDPCVDPN